MGRAATVGQAGKAASAERAANLADNARPLPLGRRRSFRLARFARMCSVPRGVMASTLDPESSDRCSNLREAFVGELSLPS